MKYPKLTPEQNRSIKIPKEEHEYIRLRYKEHGESQRQLARAYGVSRRLITFILNPEKYQAIQNRRLKEKLWKKYYSKDKHREYMRGYRIRKKELNEVTKN